MGSRGVTGNDLLLEGSGQQNVCLMVTMRARVPHRGNLDICLLDYFPGTMNILSLAKGWGLCPAPRVCVSWFVITDQTV